MTVIVLGGGASGLVAAITAAQRGNTVIVLERQSRVGRKLLATGNGRCNLTNMNLNRGNYPGGGAFAACALKAFGPEKALAFFHELGLVTVTEPDGRVYPLSDQAGSVVDVLRFAMAESGVDVRCGVTVTSVRSGKSGFVICTDGETFKADRVIICCGGMAGGKLGGTGSGYDLLRGLGHSVTALSPSLVQLKTDTAFVRSLKGVRADGAVRLLDGGKSVAESVGEIQFTEYGVSGPAIFEISRAAAKARAPEITLDLMRDTLCPELESLLAARQQVMPHLTCQDLLTGMLHNRLGRTLLRYAGYELAAPIKELGAADISRIAGAVKNFRLTVLGTMGFDSAQVTVGGVNTDEFDPNTLQSRLVPGIYAAGEVLDVDGDCGGYNLQWAWASGRLAGMTI